MFEDITIVIVVYTYIVNVSLDSRHDPLIFEIQIFRQNRWMMIREGYGMFAQVYKMFGLWAELLWGG